MCILPDQVLRWINQSVHPAAKVQAVHRLQGGISSLVTEIKLQIDSRSMDVILRIVDNEEWLMEEPDIVAHEAESLRTASRIKQLSTPELIACDEDGNKCGKPAVLMTKLEGKVVLTPSDCNAWLDGMAHALVQIHQIQEPSFPWKYRHYQNHSAFEIPAWSSYPEQWGRVMDIVRGPRPQAKSCFIHRDYHPTNILWEDDKVSGIVDWVNACIGPAGVDIGHCRWNLAMLYGNAAADAFLDAYERHAGSDYRYDPYWDLISLVDVQYGPPSVYEGWTSLGFEGLNDRLMRERTDQYMLSLIERASRL